MPGSRKKKSTAGTAAAAEEVRGLTTSPNPLITESPNDENNQVKTGISSPSKGKPDTSSSSPKIQHEKKTKSSNEITPHCAFGAGCYWGTEKYLRHNFTTKTLVPGRIEHGEVGFIGPKGSKPNPSYQDVCTGTTGYVEVYDLEFQGGEAYYEAMVRFFFQFHDPTTFNKQGNDAGTQYSSVIYCYDPIQQRIASKVKDELQQLISKKMINCYKEGMVTTDIRMVESDFVPAHEAHQDYLMKNPRGYCNHRMYLKEWPIQSGQTETQ